MLKIGSAGLRPKKQKAKKRNNNRGPPERAALLFSESKRMTLKTQLPTDAINVFLNSNELAESITYTPSGGAAKTINAVIDRERLNQQGQDQGRTVSKECEIWIANDSTSGVTSVSKGQDTVAFPIYNQGGSNVTWRVIEIVSKDEGMWHLRVAR